MTGNYSGNIFEKRMIVNKHATRMGKRRKYVEFCEFRGLEGK